MQQLRQRVTATCHIGPLDAEETRGYIEHRLKCAGSSDKPTFDEGAFEAIHKASDGIPRRINALCDRLLLMGFLCDRSHLTVLDVDEIVLEFAEEAKVPGGAVSPGSRSSVADGSAVDLEPDLSVMQLDAGMARTLTNQLDAIGTDRHMDQLQRLERSVMRLERVNLQTLGLLRKLVGAVTKSDNETGN